MGNCLPKPTTTSKISSNENDNNNHNPPPGVVHLHGLANSPTTLLIGIALSYKRAISVQYHPAASPDCPVALHCGADTVMGPLGAILQYVDRWLPGPAVYVGALDHALTMMAPVLVVQLQHRSFKRQLERVAAWAAEMAAEGACSSTYHHHQLRRHKMEMRRLARTYGQLAELLLEHARMEETLVFPLLEKADPGSCNAANEEHARDLPVINGIKEDIKSTIALDAGNAAYREALLNLSLRLNTLLEHCREHFAMEERDLLPLLEVVERGGGGEEKEMAALERVVMGLVMEGTHSHLFHVLINGLLPHEAMQYLELVCRCRDQDRVVNMLSTLAVKMEAAVALGVTSSVGSSSYWTSSHAVRQVASG